MCIVLLSGEVKRAGDNQLGVRTQCVVAATMNKTDPSTLTNMCLKINAKLGGTNSTTVSRYTMYDYMYSTYTLYDCVSSTVKEVYNTPE